MSTLQEFLQNTRKRNLGWWFSYYKQYLLNLIYEKKVSNVDDSWKDRIKTKEPIIPQGWTSEGAFEFLGKEYSGLVMKKFKD